MVELIKNVGAFVMSLTHLRIDSTHPLSVRIKEYQKKRNLRLANQLTLKMHSSMDLKWQFSTCLVNLALVYKLTLLK